MKRTGRKRRERKAQRAKAAQPVTSPPSPPVENAGGFGGPHSGQVTETIPHGNEELIRNQRIETRAILDQWPIKDQYREPLVNGQVMIALDPQQEPRNRTRAFMALMAANKQNMEARGEGTRKSETTVNVAVVNNEVQVKVDDDWYGNRDRIAQITAGHGSDTAGSSVESDP